MSEGPKDWSPRQHLAIKINAGHDTNGNPRRGWAITSCRSGELVDFVDEGYTGTSSLRRAYPHAAEATEFKVTPGQYRYMKNEFKKGRLSGGHMGRSNSMKVKRKAPPVLMAWVKCRKQSGVRPGVKMTASQKSAARTCVMREMKGR